MKKALVPLLMICALCSGRVVKVVKGRSRNRQTSAPSGSLWAT